MFIFLMLCSNDNDNFQVKTTLYITLKALFRNMDPIPPNIIVINKNKIVKIAISKAIYEDI